LYIDFLCHIWDAVGRKLPPKIENLFLLQDSASALRSVLVKDFLAKNGVTTLTLEHPPYLCDLSAGDF
jgi:hypothetical protein